MSIRDQVEEADDLAEKVIDVPEWGVKLGVRAPSVKVRASLIRDASNDDDPAATVDRLFPSVVIACTFDPESGEPAFSEDDREMLVGKSESVVRRVAQEALRVSGLAADSEEALGKD